MAQSEVNRETWDSTPSSPSGLVFAGKFAFILPSNTQLISLSSAGTGTSLGIASGSSTPVANQMFNLYGDLTTGFVMQAPNWSYVAYSNGYVADKKRTDSGLSTFFFQPIDNSTTYIIEKVGKTEYYLNANGTTLQRIAKTDSPPSTAKFQNQVVTDGLATMQQQHSTLGNPLTGVYLAEQDLSKVALSATDLSYANFSGANLTNVRMNGATASNTIFDDANLTECVANGTSFDNCSFVKANMAFIKLASSSFQGCTLNLAQFNAPGATGAAYTNLQQANFTNTAMVGCQFGNALVNDAIFNGAILINTDFSKARGNSSGLDFRGAILIGANLAGINFTTCKIDSNTNFMSANLNGCNFTSLDLSNTVFARATMQKVQLDKSTLNGVQMAFADLSYATVTGGVSLIGANLSNANLQATDFTGAQLGAKSIVMTLPIADAAILDKKQVPQDLQDSSLKIPATATVTVTQPGTSWSITNAGTTYNISKSGDNLSVQTGNNANSAILSNAYMANAVFVQANMYAVQMSGAHWYGGSASAQGADLSLANLSNGNYSGMSFVQTNLQGASFDYALLIGTTFSKTQLNPSANLKATSFAFASLQSASFTDTDLYSANLTNAAVALSDSNVVPLFPINVVTGLVKALDAANASSSLITDAFSNAGYPLISKAASITVDTAGSAWTINNIDGDEPAQTGYGNFKLALVQDKNGVSSVQVSGATPLLVLQVGASGQQQQMQLSFGATALAQNQLNGETTCASGIKYKLLSDYLTYTNLMTAATPPKPPVCANCWG